MERTAAAHDHCRTSAGLSRKTRIHYGQIYDKHVLPELGKLPLRELTPEVIARWQADRLAAGSGPTAVRHAGSPAGLIDMHRILAQHAVLQLAVRAGERV